jgi:hypothetical protein
MNQSFIGCIADAIFFTKLGENKEPMQIPTIKKMKEIIIDSLTIDSYLTFQNGNLVNTFMVDAGMGEDVVDLGDLGAVQTFAWRGCRNRECEMKGSGARERLNKEISREKKQRLSVADFDVVM